LRCMRPTRFLATIAMPAVVAAVLVAAVPSQAAPYVYVAGENGASVFQYGLEDDGSIAPLSPPTVATGDVAGDVAVHPDGQSAYVTTEDGVAQYDVQAGGLLQPKSPATVAAGILPTSVAISPDGRSAYVSNGESGTISQYNVLDGGALSPKQVSSIALDPSNPFEQAYFVTVSPDGRSVYATNGGTGATGAVYQFNVARGGELSPKGTRTVAAGSRPNAITVHPNGKSAYVANGLSNTISLYDVGPGGQLRPMSPSTVGTGEGPLEIAVRPDGQSAYVTNFGLLSQSAGSITQYDVEADGSLAPKSPLTVAAGLHARSIALSDDGESVYVTDFGSVGLGGGQLLPFDVAPGARLVPDDQPPLTLPGGANPTGIALTPILPTSGADVLTGTAGPNVICGLGGSDTIRGLGGNDALYGDRCGTRASVAGSALAAARAGHDVLRGGPGRDRLHGGLGRDRLHGGAGRDELRGGPGTDRLRGGAGHDRLHVLGGGRDRVHCGDGRDIVRADARDVVRRCERILRR
jgi:6-phosphogluconolactonase (cycloisomerase 2 family)